MSKNRYSARTDSNQSSIVKQLRAIPGVSVETDCDDIFVGFRGQNYWFEIKTPDAVSKRTGEIKPSFLKPSQVKLLREWSGHYSVVWNIDQILTELGVKR